MNRRGFVGAVAVLPMMIALPAPAQKRSTLSELVLSLEANIAAFSRDMRVAAAVSEETMASIEGGCSGAVRKSVTLASQVRLMYEQADLCESGRSAVRCV